MSDQGLQSSNPETEAAEWFARLKTRRVSLQTLRDFQAWREAEGHDAAYRRVEATWSAAGALRQDPDIQAATKAVRSSPPPKPSVVWTAATRGPRLLGAFAVLLLATGAFFGLSDPSQTFTSKLGEQKVVRLADGSQVRLNTDTQVRVRFHKHVRNLELLRGEAFFEAAHDPSRPFVVEAADANVHAVGTKFDVRRGPDGVWVALLEGKVRVDQDHRATSAILEPNQQLTVNAKGISRATATDAAQSTSWTTGRLTFHDVPLSEAIDQVNRYTATKVILDAPLGDSRVTGVFNTGDTKAFVAAVTAFYALQAEPGHDGDIHLVRPVAPPAG